MNRQSEIQCICVQCASYVDRQPDFLLDISTTLTGQVHSLNSTSNVTQQILHDISDVRLLKTISDTCVPVILVFVQPSQSYSKRQSLHLQTCALFESWSDWLCPCCWMAFTLMTTAAAPCLHETAQTLIAWLIVWNRDWSCDEDK